MPSSDPAAVKNSDPLYELMVFITSNSGRSSACDPFWINLKAEAKKLAKTADRYLGLTVSDLTHSTASRMADGRGSASDGAETSGSTFQCAASPAYRFADKGRLAKAAATICGSSPSRPSSPTAKLYAISSDAKQAKRSTQSSIKGRTRYLPSNLASVPTE